MAKERATTDKLLSMNDFAESVPRSDLAAGSSDTNLTKWVRQEIAAIAARLGAGKPGLVYHRPVTWAEASRCFENVAAKVQQDGGKLIPGWTFHRRKLDQSADDRAIPAVTRQLFENGRAALPFRGGGASRRIPSFHEITDQVFRHTCRS